MARALRVLLAGLLVVILAVLALPVVSPWLGWDAFRAAAPERQRLVPIGEGRELNVLDVGGGPPVVLVHGLPGDHTHVAALGAALAERGFRALSYDRIGWGHSSRRPAGEAATPERNARELLALLDVLDLDGATWLGFSYGGGVVLEAARLAPERPRRIVLLSSVGPARVLQEPPALARLLFSEPVLDWALATGYTARGFAGGALRALFTPEGEPPPEIVARMLANLALPGTTNTWLREGRDRLGVRLDPSHVRVPALVIHGTADGVVAASVGRDLASTIPGAVWHEVEGGSHALPMTRPDALAERIARFLR